MKRLMIILIAVLLLTAAGCEPALYHPVQGPEPVSSKSATACVIVITKDICTARQAGIDAATVGGIELFSTDVKCKNYKVLY